MPHFRVSWHHRVLCEALERVARGETQFLIVEAPPRHTKSELVSRRFPAWLLGRNPDEHIIACSYSHTLASAMNRDVQRIMSTDEYKLIFPQTQLFGKNVRTMADGSWLRNNEIFEVVDRRGYYRSAGVGGGITGLGFSVGIIDDPIKDEKEASSPTIQESVWEWYTSTFLTRAEKDARQIITMTRWNLNDLVGRILSEGDMPDGLEIVRLPAIAEGDLHADDPRSEGDALWPSEFPVEKLEERRKRMPASQWAAMYQQNPVPKGGSTFKIEWIKPDHYVDAVPAGMRTLWYWDNAGTAGGGAHTAGALMGVHGGLFYVLRVVRGQWSAAERESVKRACAEWAKGRYGTTTVWNEIEPGSGGKEQFEATVRNLAGFAVKGDKVTGDKESRAEPFAAQMEVGNVRFFRDPDHGYLTDVLNELSTFPKGRYKDQVDALAGAFAKLTERKEEARFERWL